MLRIAAYNSILVGLGIAPEMEALTPFAEGFSHGRITAINSSAFAGANFHAELTAFAARQSDPEQASLADYADFLAPSLYSPSGLAEYGTFDNIDGFRSNTNTSDDLRGIGGDFLTLENPPAGIAEQRIPNRGLAIEIDEDQERDGQWQRRAVTHLQGILLRNRIRRAVAILAGIASTASKTWNGTSGENPDSDIRLQMDTAAATLGFRPNRVAYDPLAMSYRKTSFEAQTTAGGFAGAQRDIAALSNYLGAEVREIKARYATSASARTPLLGSGKVVIFPGAAVESREDISAVKTFYKNCEGGTRQRVLVRQVGDKRWRVVVEGYDQCAAVSTLGVRIITITGP